MDTRVNRIIAGVLLASFGGVLAVAAFLTPAGGGHGTHTQLGLAPCSFLAATGKPCVSCGMTTSFTHAADGNLLAAAATQPAGAVLALLSAMTVLAAGWSLWTGRSLGPLGRAVLRPLPMIMLGGVVLGGWGYRWWRMSG
jgi:hypothetical protein